MAISKGLFLFFAFMGLVIAVAVYISKQPGGYITTRGGSVCSWRTDGDPNTERGLIMDCSCPNGVEYGCRYQARPDEDCPKFWKNLLPYFTNLTTSIASKRWVIKSGCGSCN